MFDKLKAIDRQIFIYLNSLGVENYDLFWGTITQIKVWIPLFLFFFYLIIKYYKKDVAIKLSAATIVLVIFVAGLTDLVKNLVGRVRPSNNPDLAEVIRALQTPHNYSFFSGHASSSFALTTFVVLLIRHHTKWAYTFYVWPILLCFSRIYVGVHYPSDILVGALVGTSIAFFCYKWYVKPQILLKHSAYGKPIS
ncbi:phosphatase PAP2 family protein [Zhouia sp. PK063]|uniref:phosphatase PAP2 family protein n=1 Tax=Zhouia sp. PK063 TaxID=3373602 RepID=UPI0037A400E6